MYILISGINGFFFKFYQSYSTNSLEYILRNFFFFSGEKDPPKIYKCIAKNAMWFFLLANLMTGMVNLSFQSALATDLTARMILIVYILVLCVIFNIKEELHT